MENNFEGALAITDKPKKENLVNKIVIENFGEWNNFRRIVEDARKNVDYNPSENKICQRKFIREILGSYAGKINSADFEKLSYLITKEIKELERRKEKNSDTKEKYVQRDMPFTGRGKE